MGKTDKPDSGQAASEPQRGAGRAWPWAVGAAIAALVVWQLAHGFFVQSITTPGGGAITFGPRDSPEAHDNNLIEQTRGSENEASVEGASNTIRQVDGSHNRAIVNGVGNRVEQR